MNGPRLHFISGKGGVGKTLIASGLAAAYAARGQKTILVSYDTSPLHPYFRIERSYAAVQVRRNLDLSSLDAQSAILEYVKRNVPFGAAYAPLLRNESVQRFLHALPIFDELITLGKIYDLATHPDSPYEHVVVDAPATGHSKVILQVADVAASTLVAGPIYTNSVKIRDALKDTAVSELIITTLPEATPVREALELQDFTRRTGTIHCSRMIVNRCIEQHLQAAELEEIRMFARDCRDAMPLFDANDLHHCVADEQAVNLASLATSDIPVHRLAELRESGRARLKAMSRMLDEVIPHE